MTRDERRFLRMIESDCSHGALHVPKDWAEELTVNRQPAIVADFYAWGGVRRELP